MQQNSMSVPALLILLAILSVSVMNMSNSAENMIVGGIFFKRLSGDLSGNNNGELH